MAGIDRMDGMDGCCIYIDARLFISKTFSPAPSPDV